MKRLLFAAATVTFLLSWGRLTAKQPAADSGGDHAWLANVLRSAIPREYEDRRRWDRKKRIISGVRGKLFDPHWRYKEVRHGRWKRSKVELIEPDKRLKLDLKNVRRVEEGKYAFDLAVAGRVHITAQHQNWRRDIKLYSVSGVAEADLELDLTCEMAVSVEPDALLPSVALEPAVKDAQIRLKRFKLLSLGNADGPIVREFGDMIEGEVAAQLKDRKKKIVDKINRSLEKRQDKLRFSVTELAQGQWTRLFAPSEEQK